MASHDVQVTSPTSHRLPTVSASQALQNLSVRGARTISSGLAQLDSLLAPPSLPGHNVSGGYPKGKVTEIFGPSGVGKTTYGIQAAINTLNDDQGVVWVDAACAPLIPHRVLDLLRNSRSLAVEQGMEVAPSSPTGSDGRIQKFHHFTTPTLAHLLALFMHPVPTFPPKDANLIVIDSLSTLIDNAYPRSTETKHKTEQSRWAAGRRFTVINDIMSALSKFAALHDIAMIVTCQTITRMRGASRAVLVPAISGVEWENGISTRLVLFRDWVRQGKLNHSTESERIRKTRFVGILKANGTVLADEGGVGNVVPFAIESGGLCDINIAADNIATRIVLPVENRPPKRPLADLDEHANQEPNSDELYGWIEDDEVAAEGLLIDEAPMVETTDDVTQPPVELESRSNKVIRLSTT